MGKKGRVREQRSGREERVMRRAAFSAVICKLGTLALRPTKRGIGRPSCRVHAHGHSAAYRASKRALFIMTVEKLSCEKFSVASET